MEQHWYLKMTLSFLLCLKVEIIRGHKGHTQLECGLSSSGVVWESLRTRGMRTDSVSSSQVFHEVLGMEPRPHAC